MVSTMDVAGGKPDSKANWNKNKQKPLNQVPRFGSAATLDNVLHGKVITTGANQDGQIMTLVKAIPSFMGINHDADWVESFCNMTRKLKPNS